MIRTRPELRPPIPKDPPRTGQDRVTVNCVEFSRLPASPDGALRKFEADIELARARDAGGMSIGRVSGRLGWLSWLPELADATRAEDDIDVNATTAIAVGNALSPTLDATIGGVLIIEQFWLEPAWRGAGLTRKVADQLMDLLLLTPETTLIIATTGPLYQRSILAQPDASLAHRVLAQEYREAGLEQWLDGDAWYLRPTCGEAIVPSAV